MSTGRIALVVGAVAAVLVLAFAAWQFRQRLRDILQPTMLVRFDAPVPTAWEPPACRDFEVPPTLPGPPGWKGLHGDGRSSDEVGVALPPAFARDWVAETDSYHVTGPVFDAAGNLYLSPYLPNEDVMLVSLEPGRGKRRFAIPATTPAPVGFAAPLVVSVGEGGEDEWILQVLYDRAVAIRTDGSVVWDVAAGFPGEKPAGVIGLQYHAGADAIVALSTDGWLVALDRETGASLLQPHRFPGLPAPGRGVPEAPVIAECMRERFGRWIDLEAREALSEGAGGLLLGRGVHVSSSFSVDPTSGRLWVVAMAPDAADGAEDGNSALGALYGLDLVRDGSGARLAEACRATFEGGSATTPALRADGQRIYVGDSQGALLAFDRDCALAWEHDVRTQITGSVAVASDGGELYVSTDEKLRLVFDRGDHAEAGWTADLGVYDVSSPLTVVNQNIATVGANGVLIQAALAVQAPMAVLPLSVAMVLLDRATGKPRYATEGVEETLSVMAVAPDGQVFVAGSPLRRVITECVVEGFPALRDVSIARGFGIEEAIPPLASGVARYAPTRWDLLAREAGCAAFRRARNAGGPGACESSQAHDGALSAQLARQALLALEVDGGTSELDALRGNLERLAEGDFSAGAALEPLCAPVS